MIILKFKDKCNNKITINQKSYNKIIKQFSASLFTVHCQVCDNNNWYLHCSYDRRIDFFGYQIKIRIVRIKCSCCNATNAILIEDMVPFYRLTHETIIKVIESDSCDLASHKKYLLSNFIDIDIHSYDDVCQHSCKIKNRSINIIFCSFST